MHQPLTRLNVVCTLWQKEGTSSKKFYGPEHVNALEMMLVRETSIPVQLWCVTDDERGISQSVECIHMPTHAKKLPAQYPKLWLFSGEFADHVGWGEQFLFTDLDVVIVGDISKIVSPVDIMRFRSNYHVPGKGASCKLKRKFIPGRFYRKRKAPPFSACFFWFTAGALRHLWDSFDLSYAKRIRGWKGDEQKWMNYVLGLYVPFWAPLPYFSHLRKLDRQGKEPEKDVVCVVCTYLYKPWDPTLRDRNPWLRDRYPITE